MKISKAVLRFVFAALLMFGFALGASAQTRPSPFSNTFTFTGGRVVNLTQAPCGAITEWDGVPNAYPEEMGAVCPNGYFPSIDVPDGLGYLNNGYLDPCDPLTWGPKVYTQGDGTHNGDLYTQTGSTTCPYFTGEYGTYENSNNRLEGWTITADYKVNVYTTFYHGSPIKHYFIVLLGGTGTVTDTIIGQ